MNNGKRAELLGTAIAALDELQAALTLEKGRPDGWLQYVMLGWKSRSDRACWLHDPKP